MNDSHLVVNDGKITTWVGPDATHLYRATILWAGLKLYAKSGIIPTRTATPMKMLKMASFYTGKTYKRGQYLQAAEDVKKWADEMKAALPKVEN